MFERPILQCVGGQLMQGKAKRLHEFEVQRYRRPLYLNLVAFGGADGLELKADQIAEIDLVDRSTADETLDAPREASLADNASSNWA